MKAVFTSAFLRLWPGLLELEGNRINLLQHLKESQPVDMLKGCHSP